ncbi:replication initiator [Actinoplanes sp. NPDC020271]|uniref:replication initiator n=1 Tax=Actinoplanes sp. NPDC020271 TaxID=3363896 RepID=UPI00378CB2B4
MPVRFTDGRKDPIHQGRPCSCRRHHTADDPLLGTPVDPSRYDYRRAAWDAVHFPRLLNRYWQTCAGRSAGTCSTRAASSRRSVWLRTPKASTPAPATWNARSTTSPST